jgi:hypothetical protein
MKHETLVTRYKNLGYTPIGGDRDQEIASLIKWIWVTYGYWIDCLYIDMKINDGEHYQKFLGRHMMVVDGHRNSCSCKKSFKNPYDALFDAVRDIYRHLNFMGYIIILRKHFTEEEVQKIINLKQGALWASRNLEKTRVLLEKVN